MHATAERDQDAISEALAELGRHYPGGLPVMLADAVALARRGHAAQRRRSGEPYVIHPIRVAVLLAESDWDLTTVAAGVCHDLLEDTAIGAAEIEATIGADGLMLVQGVTRLDHVRTHEAAGEAADIQRLLGAVAGDVRVLAVKLADRLHNIRTLHHLPAERRQRIARQTLELLAPLAHRISALTWARELEERCFPEAYPDEAAALDAELASTAVERGELERDAVAALTTALASAGIEARVESRTKSRWSLWNKAQRVGGLDQVWDQLGIRVVTADTAGCYAALGVVHTTFTPMPGRFKDYIALPKENRYRSLHTTVVDAQGRHFEVQMRDEVMDREAKYGAAAHYRYKQGPTRPGPRIDTDATELGPEQFLEELRAELADNDQVLVLTPRGDVVRLPQGACAIDFAYAVHTELGHRLVGAKVNGRLVPIRAALTTGDTIEVLTRTNGQPSRDWLEAVASAGARAKLRRYFAQTDRAEHERAGRQAVEKALHEAGLDGISEGMLIRAGVNEPAELYRLVGAGRLDVSRIVARREPLPRRLAPRWRRRTEPRAPEAVVSPESRSVLHGLRSQLAGCCAPSETDDLVGYVSVGRGLIVHRADCVNLVALEASLAPEQRGRIMALSGAKSTVIVHAADREGLLADVAAVFAELGIRIAGSQTGATPAGVELRLGVASLDPELTTALVERLEAVASVAEVKMRAAGRG